MSSALVIAGLWLLFAGSHVALATSSIRASLVGRLGARGFGSAFVIVAWITFALLVAVYTHVRLGEPVGVGLGLAHVEWVRTVLLVIVGFGIVLIVGSFAPAGYWESPSAIFMDQVREPRGLERVTRHPTFCGIALVMGAHALLATRISDAVFFAGFVALSVLGPMHQSSKLRRRFGTAYERYLETSSAVPFLAIARGRQRFVAREMPWITLAIGVAAVFVLRWVHGGILAWSGAPFIGVTVAATAIIGVVTSRREARARGALERG